MTFCIAFLRVRNAATSLGALEQYHSFSMVSKKGKKAAPVPYARFDAVQKDSPASVYELIVGGCVASFYCVMYMVSPASVLTALAAIFLRPLSLSTWIFVAVLLFFAFLPVHPRTWILKTPAFNKARRYFDYSEIVEIPDSHLLKSERNYIVGAVPHGIITFGGLCSAACGEGLTCTFASRGLDVDEWSPRREEIMGVFKTACASVCLYLPLLNHALGIFGLLDASKHVLKAYLKKKKSSLIIYIGGIAEMFKSCEETEVILTGHKGFVRLALEQGADIFPVYFMGNTTVLSVLKIAFLERLSRRLSMAVTYFWGWMGTPVPRPKKIIYLRGRPLSTLGLPVEPVVRGKDEDEEAFKKRLNEATDKWYAVFMDEVTRLFDTYKKFHPDFEHKTLELQDGCLHKKKKD